MRGQATPTPNSRLVNAPLLATHKPSSAGSSGSTFQTKLTLQTSVTGASSSEQEACFASALNCIKRYISCSQAQQRERRENVKARSHPHSNTCKQIRSQGC